MKQRELKFRVWTGKEMLYPDDIGNFAIDDLRNKLWKSVMQYTGIRDRGGREVYEGDIIELADGNKGIVKFKNGSFFHTATSSINGLLYWDKVIGNIYENPKFNSWKNNL